MNKILLSILCCFFSLYLHADSIVMLPPNVKADVTKVNIDRDSALENRKFKPNFKTAYQNQPEFDYSSASPKDGFFTRLKNRFLHWLESLFNVEVADNPKQIWNTALNYFSVVLLLGLTFYIVRAFIRKDFTWFFKKSKESFEVHYDDVEKNLEQTNFEVLIEQALKNDDHRLVVRYYYLWLLKILSQREIIKWDLEKTNSDYLAEIKNEDTRKSFQYLSYLYNNIWYGEFDMDRNASQKAQQAFTDFLNPWINE